MSCVARMHSTCTTCTHAYIHVAHNKEQKEQFGLPDIKDDQVISYN